MATEEKSRDAFEPMKRYAAVGMQLGRVLVDDDFNEAERIRLEEDRRVNLDVIGPVGSPDDGFKIVNGTGVAAAIDFEIAAGTLYLGGLRLWNPQAVKYSLQGDWLQQPASERPALVVDRTDLVYLEAWQQPVTAIEDSELFEVALGGPDTSDRLRTMWRVHVVPDVDGADCPAAWADVVAGWAAEGLGTVGATAERLVDTKLTVTYTGGVTGDLCTPSIAAGYLGAENQTIRVQLVDDGTLTWGFDNAAPVYRALVKGADRKTLELLTDPRDGVHWPMHGQVVEILPWSAVLSNNEKLAEETGYLDRVDVSYTPTSHELTLSAGVPATFGQAWKSRADMAALGSEYVFVRVWNRGDDILSPTAIPFAVGTPVDLGTTGIRVTITGTSFAAGDHWVIAARPKTPDQVVPWDLETGRRVSGTRRFYAPLGLVRWNADGTFDLLHDCRPHFQPLTRIKGCCTYTVGDDVSSFGQFKTIQAAINALPSDGGRVCVLPGEYREVVVLFNKQNVTIEGCGARSRIVPPDGAIWNVVIVGGRDIALRDLAIECADAHGVVLFDWSKTGSEPTSIADAAWSGFEGGLTRVRLEGLLIKNRGRTAIAAIGGVDVTIRGCEIQAGPLEVPITPGSDLGLWPAIVSFADDLLIADNRVLAKNEVGTLPGATTASGLVTFTRTAMGGIQLGGGSRRVELRGNLIAGGNGDGITLGSWAWVPDPNAPFDEKSKIWDWWGTFTITINDEGCIEIDWDPDPQDPDEQDWVPVSMGDLRDISIIDNTIQLMGKSGIGVARFFDLAGQDELIAVHRLLIRDNKIGGCVRLPIPELPDHMTDVAAQGVITLAEVSFLRVTGNELRRNGRRHVDPLCGIFALISTGVVIEHNVIVDNAPYVATQEPVRPGWRGGVVLTRAFPPPWAFQSPELKGRIRRMTGEPTARISDNEIIVPEGRCLAILGAGPMVIADNHLTTQGPALADWLQIFAGAGNLPGTLQLLLDVIGGTAVAVLNTGLSNELLLLQLLSYNNLGGIDLDPGPGIDPRPPIAASGNVMFVDNQVNIDMLRPGSAAILSAIAIASLDDVEVTANQIELDRLLDRVFASVLTIGMSTRVQNNRVKESLVSEETSLEGVSIFSNAFLMNMTNGNQTTRCINALGNMLVRAPNQVLLEGFVDGYCNPNEDKIAKVTQYKLKGEAMANPPGGPNADVVERGMVMAYDAGDAMQRTYMESSLPIESVRASQQSRELARLRAVYGEDSPVVAEAEALHADTKAKRLAAEGDAARARIERIGMTPDTAVVHGIVLGKGSRPTEGLDVRVVDANGGVVASTRTNDGGYFRLDLRQRQREPQHQGAVIVEGKVPPRGDKGKGRTQPLALEIAQGERVVYRDRRPVAYKEASHRYREIRLEDG